MSVERKLFKVSEDDPSRCQAIFKNGQCQFKSQDGSKYCAMHGGNKAGEVHNKLITRQYRLAQWQARVGEFAEHDSVKTLREEIGIARLLLENLVTQCQGPNDLLLYSSKIGEMVSRIEKLVQTCDRLETRMGMLLDKAGALHLASQMVEIITTHIEDEEIINQIATEIASAIANIQGNTEK